MNQLRKKSNLLPKIGIIIPCYKAKGLINIVVDRILIIADHLKEEYILKIYIVNDCCTEESLNGLRKHNLIKVLNHSKNLGVGASTMTGFNSALKDKCEAFIKIDADGQHNPNYLFDLIPYLFSLESYKLTLIKGTRYFSPEITKNVPFVRRVGSIFLEPICRGAICYRKLTDITNGFLAFNLNTLENILSPALGSKLESRYLFESSILAKCSEIDCEIHEFAMISRYSPHIKSSLKSSNMIFPLFFFWIKTLNKRLLNKYFFSLNLGSILLFISSFNIIYALRLFFVRIYSNVTSNILVSAGTSAAFTSSITISIICFCFFLFYDYGSGKTVKKIKFKTLIEELNSKKYEN